MKSIDYKLAIAPIGWSNDDLPELGGHITFEQCISEMALAGYHGCEVGNKFPRDITLLTKALNQHDLKVASAWYSLYFTEEGREQETIAGFITHMNFLKAMGASVIVVCECGHSVQGKSVPLFENKPVFTDKQWQFLLIGLELIGKLARDNGMTLVYHYHMGTGIQQQEDINQLMEKTNPNKMSLLLDTGHLTYAGGDILTLIKNHGDRIKHVHLKDIRKDVLGLVKENHMNFLDSVKAGVFTVPGDGSIDFRPIFQALKEIQYTGWWVVEAEQDPDLAHPLTCASIAKTYLDKHLLLKEI
jgi:inosose dehydratase